ncbi:hypothetical protein [Streptomyces sp. NBC_00059]|uniref:hypothetical protein n=1 Tax=Streptomyces sp. NBC_00059 TaxID=2975635 RepID=UPI002253DED6|nr:hypothetical protein [Streptomyces sp. NBC_00059]MCX5417594.1 hypothetical protein [Streptomyces sp. NBC_00059]
MRFPYVGSGPYCYTNSLTMVLGAQAPGTHIVECLTGSPFGVQLIGGRVPFFDPYGWDPEIGLNAAIGLLGLRCERTEGGSPEDAAKRLRAASEQGPVLVGPLDMGLLLHQPGSGTAQGADHYVVVIEVAETTVVFHDPHGHPYASLPSDAFMQAWRADEVAYIETPYVMRTGFRREAEVAPADALRASLPAAASWLAGRYDLPNAPGSSGGADALAELSAWLERGLAPETRHMLESFGLRAGARRLSDAATCFDLIGLSGAAEAAAAQARRLGALQYELVTGNDTAVAAGLRALAPGYDRLRELIEAA